MKPMMHILIIVTIMLMLDFSYAMGQDIPDSAYISGVIGHAQGYALSCESRSAADLAGYWGVSLGESEFLQALPKSDNPDQGFVGSPNEVWGQLPPHGYGVHAWPVAVTLRAFGVHAEAYRHLSWDDIRSEISTGHPVIVWIIGTMWPGTATDYQASDGSTARVAAFEHTMLMTGYNMDSVEVIDAYSGQYQYYSLNSFFESWSVLGNMAVFVSGTDQQRARKIEANGNTYTVKSGDYLMALARDFGVNWLDLAQLNVISYPYTIFAGQVLKLPAGSQSVEIAPDPAVENSEPDPGDHYLVHLPLVESNGTTSGESSGTVPAANQEVTETVIVMHTDTLINFGRSIGVAWHVLAEINHLPPTFVLHPGQILKVK
jgi:uncharacterized protein YvpB/LysM repeat protein